MTYFALAQPNSFPLFPPAEGAASRESRVPLRAWWECIRRALETASSPLVPAAVHRLTSQAYADKANLPDELFLEAESILERLADIVPHASAAIEVPIHLAILDDDSAVLEWIRSDRRLGFSLEKNKEESGWFYIYSAGSSMRSEAGSMDQLELGRLVEMMSRR